MNILFIGPYRQSDGWGNASRNYLKALTMTKYNISARPVYLNNQKTYEKFYDEYILRAENNSSNKYDVVIQNGLPHLFRRFGKSINIGISFFETTIKNTPWPRSIDIMDMMWVSSSYEKFIVDSACNTEVKLVGIPYDISVYKKDISYNSVIEKNPDSFYFYFIGENIKRKNIRALLTAFHLEFRPYEKVDLVLKVNSVGKDGNSVSSEINTFINMIKDDIGMYKDKSLYKKEIIITEFLEKKSLSGLHRDCDCFVMPSSGEGFCMPAFDAILNDSWVIANKNSGMFDYIEHDYNGYLINSTISPAIAEDKPLQFLYNGRDYWHEIQVDDLRLLMRRAYENKEEIKLKLKNNISSKIIQHYSYETVSKTIESILDNYVKSV